MRKAVSLLTALLLLCSVMAAASADIPCYDDDETFPDYAGRLRIPAVTVDVALYRSMAQSVVDRKDSAAIFGWSGTGTEIIADHNTQAFAGLLDVKVGMVAYIQPPDGDIITLVCVEVLDGKNTGKDIIDLTGCSAIGNAAFLMYTCRQGKRNVRICQWEIQ